MSANPQAMMQMLASGLGGQQQQNPQAQVSPLGAGAQLAQKIMLMKMLQAPPQQPGQPPAAVPGAPQPQQPNAMPMPGGVNA